MRYDRESIPDRSRPILPTTASGVARQGTCRNYVAAEHSENKRRKKDKMKASEEATGIVEREIHKHKSGYLKYWNNDWKGERAGRLDGAKECKYTMPTGNKMEKK